MTGWDLLPRIVGLLGAAALSGLLLRRLGQNVIVGYLLAGLLLGPTGIGWVNSDGDVAVLSELGVALLLFSIGLEFSFQRLRQLGSVATVGGSLQVLLTTAGVYYGCLAFGLPSPAAMAIGLGFAMSSTAVVLRELTDRAQLDSSHGRNAIGKSVIPLIDQPRHIVFGRQERCAGFRLATRESAGAGKCGSRRVEDGVPTRVGE